MLLVQAVSMKSPMPSVSQTKTFGSAFGDNSLVQTIPSTALVLLQQTCLEGARTKMFSEEIAMLVPSEIPRRHLLRIIINSKFRARIPMPLSVEQLGRRQTEVVQPCSDLKLRLSAQRRQILLLER